MLHESLASFPEPKRSGFGSGNEANELRITIDCKPPDIQGFPGVLVMVLAMRATIAR